MVINFEVDTLELFKLKPNQTIERGLDMRNGNIGVDRRHGNLGIDMRHDNMGVDTRMKEVVSWMYRGLGCMAGCIEEKDDLNTSPTSVPRKSIVSKVV